MKTIITTFDDKRIYDLLKENQVISFPTETVYGLGVVYDSKDAFDNLVKVKQRNPDKPFTLMLHDKKHIEQFAYINDKTKKIIDKFFPGELTILVKPKEDVYPWVKLDSKYIGIRVPNSKEVCLLIENLNKGMLVTSANISSEPACKNFEEVLDVFNNKVPLIVKGNVESNVPSTIVICDEELILVREGKLSYNELREVWEE